MWLEFRDAFRKEFGKSLGLGVLFGGLLAGSYYLLSLGLSNGGNPYGLLFSGGGLCLLAIAVLWGQYSFVLLPSLDLPLGAILRNGWSLAFLGAPSSLGILALVGWGLVQFWDFHRRMFVRPATGLPEHPVRAALLNPGMLLWIAAFLVMCVISLLS